MSDELRELHDRIATLELEKLATQRAFEVAGQSGESQLASLNDTYNAIFMAHEGLRAIAAALAEGAVGNAQALVHRLLLRLVEYDPQAYRLPFADVPAGGTFRFGGVTFRKFKNVYARRQQMVNARGVDEGQGAWFEDDIMVTVVEER